MIENPIILQSNHARYDDETYSTITIEWVSKEDGKLRTHCVPADPSNADYRDLMDHHGWTEEDLVKQTEVWKKQQSRAFNMDLRRAVEKLAEEQVAEKKRAFEISLQQLDEKQLQADLKLKAAAVEVNNQFWDALLAANEDRDQVFKFKLWALEQDGVKDASSEQKKELRKQDTILNCLAYFNSINN